MLKGRKESVLSSKITSLISSAPDFGEEEDDLTRSHEIAHDDKLSDSGDEINLSQFRKINIELLDSADSKYKGVRASRKDFEGEKAFQSDSGEDSSDESDTGSIGSSKHGDAWSDTGHPESQSDEHDSEGTADSESGEEEQEDTEESDETQDITISSDKISSDIDKGNAIRNQFAIWDTLLECRIKFQKCLTVANKLPHATTAGLFNELGGDDVKSAQATCQTSLKKVLNSLLELQSACQSTNTKHFEDSTKDSDDEILSSESEDKEMENEDQGYHKRKKRRKLSDFAEEITERHAAFIPFRNDTIQKWNEKTRLSQVGSKDFSAFEQSTLAQIANVLADKQRLLKRTRTMRSTYHILGEDDEPPSKITKLENSEIFDDDDFYHQLLRELLERKTTDVTDSVQLSRQWIQLQKARNKMKKSVDTKASKGRKLRYNVHEKLVNFMMPIEKTTWTDEARAELLASIFGQKTS